MRDYGEVLHYINGDDDDAVNELGWYDENDEFIFYTDKELLDMEITELLAKRAKKEEREEEERTKRLAEVKNMAEEGDVVCIRLLDMMEKREKEL